MTDVAPETPATPPANLSNPPERSATEPLRLRRSRDRRVIAGVAGGIAERFDVNENLVRAIFVALTLFLGIGCRDLSRACGSVLGTASPAGVAPRHDVNQHPCRRRIA